MRSVSADRLRQSRYGAICNTAGQSGSISSPGLQVNLLQSLEMSPFRSAEGESRSFTQETRPNSRSLWTRPPQQSRFLDYHTQNAGPTWGSGGPATKEAEEPDSRLRGWTWATGTYTRNPKPESRIPKPEYRSPKPEARRPTPETRSPQPAARNPQPATRNPNNKSTNGKRKTEKRKLKRDTLKPAAHESKNARVSTTTIPQSGIKSPFTGPLLVLGAHRIPVACGTYQGN